MYKPLHHFITQKKNGFMASNCEYILEPLHHCITAFETLILFNFSVSQPQRPVCQPVLVAALGPLVVTILFTLPDIQVMVDTEETTAGTMAVVDLDGDGYMEIVSAGFTAGTVYVYTFAPEIQ